MASLDIMAYKKHKWENIKDDIIPLFDNKNVTRNNLQKLFSNSFKEENGKRIPIPAKYRVTDYVDLPANTIGNQKTEQKDTTIGLVIFNSFIINEPFHGKMAYINKMMDKPNWDKFMSLISTCLVENKLTVEEFAEFINRIIWLGYQTELFMPGLTFEVLAPNKDIMALKKKLISENKEIFEHDRIDKTELAQYIAKIEEPLLKEAKEKLKNDPGYRVINHSGPSFGNNYKNMSIINGANNDPVTGKYKLNQNAYVEGIDLNVFDAMANKSMGGTVSRSLETQKSGEVVKYGGAANQSLKLGPKGSDCGTTGTFKYTVTEDTITFLQYMYVMINGKPVCATPEFLRNNIGKTFNFRILLYCKNKDFCNICAGDMFYKLNMTTIGLTSTVASGQLGQKLMKVFHDSTVKNVTLDLPSLTEFSK